MNRIGGIKLLVALASICLVTASAANAAVVEFRLLVAGADVATYPGAVDSTFSLWVQVRTDAKYADDGTNAYIAGVTQAAFQLKDSLGIGTVTGMVPTVATGTWTSSITGLHPGYGYAQTKGVANTTPAAGIYAGQAIDVLGAKVNVNSGYWASSDTDLGGEFGLGNTYGGSGAVNQPVASNLPTGALFGNWTTIMKGNYTYKGGTGSLTLLVDKSQQAIWNPLGAPLAATGVVGDVLNFGASNTPPTTPTTVNPALGITEASWTQEPGWNNPAHSVQVSASGSTDNGALVYRWFVTGGGQTDKYLGKESGEGALMTLTIGDLAAAGCILPAWPGETWQLTAKAYDGELYSGGMSIPMFVPEPATMGLLAVGVFGLIKRRRRA